MNQRSASEIILKVLSVVLTLAAGQVSSAGSLSADLQNQSDAQAQVQAKGLLIEKLFKVQNQLAPNDPSRGAIVLRLADLYAERARVNSMTLESNKDLDLKNQQDRKQAVKFYKEAMTSSKLDTQARILSQMGHLHELNQDADEAEKSYQKVIALDVDRKAKTEAYLSLAELYFKKSKFPKAIEFYDQVLVDSSSKSLGFALYRKSWALFNSGKTELAQAGIVEVLKNKAYLTRSSAHDSEIDLQFQEEASRDLVTFCAKRPDRLETDLIHQLSPEKARIGNLIFYASELERLGEKNNSLLVWQFVFQFQKDPKERLENLVHQSSLYADIKKYDLAIDAYNRALSSWADAKCDIKNDQCQELRNRLKNFVVDWNTREKKIPTIELLGAYKAYNLVFKDDPKMQIWSAQVAFDLKLYADSFQILLPLIEVKSSEQESALLLILEVADASEKADMRATAYNKYLSLSTAKKKEFEVQYQLASLDYELGKNAEAAARFESIAKTDKGNLEIRKKAAHLSLDANVTLGNDSQVKILANGYKTMFPGNRSEFENIQRKTSLNIFKKKAEAGQFQLAWDELNQFDLKTASNDEKLIYYKNKITLAEKLNNVNAVIQTSDQLLLLPDLSKADTDYALNKKAWASDLVLDFDSALKAVQKTSENTEQKQLKLIVYSGLAHQNPKPLMLDYLKTSKDKEKRSSMIQTLVESSEQPWTEIEKWKTELATNVELYISVVRFAFWKANDLKKLKEALKDKNLSNHKLSAALKRILLQSDWDKMLANFSNEKIDSKSQSKLAQTLKLKINSADQLERIGNLAIESGDWTSQVVVLSGLSNALNSLYSEIMSLPLPAGLSPDEEGQYLALLGDKAGPYQAKAQAIQAKVDEYWKAESIKSFPDNFKNAKAADLFYVTQESQWILGVAPVATANYFKNPEGFEAKATIVATSAEDLKAIEMARTELKNDPFNQLKLKNLMSLESRRGNIQFVDYLTGRLAALESIKTGVQ